MVAEFPWLPAIALAVGAWGAILSTVLAVRQLWLDRRRLRIVVTPLVWVAEDVILELVSVRAVCEGRRPVHVRQAGVVTEDDTIYHPGAVTPPGEEGPRQRMLTDGESVAFYFDPLTFEQEGYLPKAVWIQDFAGRRYTKRLSRKKRRAIASQINQLREQLGPDVSRQAVPSA